MFVYVPLFVDFGLCHTTKWHWKKWSILAITLTVVPLRNTGYIPLDIPFFEAEEDFLHCGNLDSWTFRHQPVIVVRWFAVSSRSTLVVVRVAICERKLIFEAVARPNNPLASIRHVFSQAYEIVDHPCWQSVLAASRSTSGSS